MWAFSGQVEILQAFGAGVSGRVKLTASFKWQPSPGIEIAPKTHKSVGQPIFSLCRGRQVAAAAAAVHRYSVLANGRNTSIVVTGDHLGVDEIAYSPSVSAPAFSATPASARSHER